MLTPIPDRRGTGVAQGLASDYPFIYQPSPDIEFLLADFWLSVDIMQPDGEFPSLFPEFPWRIGWLHGLGTGSATTSPLSLVHDVDVIVVSANGVTVFDSRFAVLQPNPLLPAYEPNGGYIEESLGPSRSLYQWATSKGVCRLIAYKNWDQDEIQRSYDNDIFPASSWLDIRTTEIAPRCLRSISVLSQKIVNNDFVLAGGYNIDTTSTLVAGAPPSTQVVLNAVPGAGLGVYNDCGPVPVPIQAINNVKPDTGGNFGLSGNGCVGVFQATEIASSSPLTVKPSTELSPFAPHLVVLDDCKACCSCDDYVGTAHNLVSLSEKYSILAAEMQTARDQYHANIRRWQLGTLCRQNNFLYLTLQAQFCPFVDVLAQYCNKSAVCQKNIQLRIRFEASPALNSSCEPGTETVSSPLPPPDNLPAYRSTGVTIVPGSTSQKLSTPSAIASYTLQGSWCDYRAYWDAVNPFDTVFVKFRLRFPYGGIVSGNAPYGMTAWLDGQVDGEWIRDANNHKLLITNTASLRCGSAGL